MRSAGLSMELADESGGKGGERRDLIVTARWALIFGCAYLILFGEARVQPASLALIAVFLASNFVLGRLPVDRVIQHGFTLSLAAVDTVLIGLSLYIAGQLNVELLALFLGVLVLAIAGLPLWAIATTTLAMSGLYLGMAWGVSGSVQWHWSTLLHAPFLLGTALTYASLTESRQGERARQRSETAVQGLSMQMEAIRRCQAALDAGSAAEARVALREIERHNRVIESGLGATPAVATETPIAVVAPSAV